MQIYTHADYLHSYGSKGDKYESLDQNNLKIQVYHFTTPFTIYRLTTQNMQACSINKFKNQLIQQKDVFECISFFVFSIG